VVCALAFVDLIVVMSRCENRSGGETLTSLSLYETPPPAGRDLNGRRRKKKKEPASFKLKYCYCFNTNIAIFQDGCRHVDTIYMYLLCVYELADIPTRNARYETAKIIINNNNNVTSTYM